ncbi:permease [Solihabitans fulvus]|uniref:Permease n=1 Tax=Solihabitans fulvus TaxID=1892852 RepID=A0A5B2WZQ1_9PSEU|nr:permease [Solihabitans fulvus]KAA2255457.1 permease [Solihabitans fulvus]
MITGHFGLAAAVKSSQRQVPLWALMLATVWLDVWFVPLVLLKVERMDPVPGTNGGYGDAIIHADYTHSLVGALIIAAVTGLLAARWWGRKSGAVIGAVVFSHWVLDLLVHRSDMPVLPGNLGNLPRMGFGLWQYPLLTAVIEGGIMLVGTVLYWRAAAKTGGPAGRVALSAGLIGVVGAATLTLDVMGF